MRRTADILRHGANLVRRGLCRGDYAQNRDGEPVVPEHTDAVCFCASGAIRRAAFELLEPVSIAVAPARQLALRAFHLHLVRRGLADIDSGIDKGISDWSDRADQTPETVAAELDACAEHPHDGSTFAQTLTGVPDAVAAYRAGEALGRGDIETATGDYRPPRSAANVVSIVGEWQGGRPLTSEEHDMAVSGYLDGRRQHEDALQHRNAAATAGSRPDADPRGRRRAATATGIERRKAAVVDAAR